MALSRAAGMPYERALAERVLAPAGLLDIEPEGFFSPPTEPGFARGAKGRMEPLPPVAFDIMAPAGFVSSSLGGLAAYARLMLNGGLSPTGVRVIGEESFRALTTRRYDPPSWPTGYGLGWMTGYYARPGAGPCFSHNGAHEGWCGQIVVLPERGKALVAFANALVPLAGLVSGALTAWMRHDAGEPFEDKGPRRSRGEQEASKRSGGEELAGRYGSTRLRREGGRLVTRMGGRKAFFMPEGGGSFALKVGFLGLKLPTHNGLICRPGESGKALALIFERDGDCMEAAPLYPWTPAPSMEPGSLLGPWFLDRDLPGADTIERLLGGRLDVTLEEGLPVARFPRRGGEEPDPIVFEGLDAGTRIPPGGARPWRARCSIFASMDVVALQWDDRLEFHGAVFRKVGDGTR